MEITKEDYVNVADRIRALELNVPSELAILPRNFLSAEKRDELLYEDSTPDVRKLWRLEGINGSIIEKEGEKLSYIYENSVDWVGPTIFYGASLLTNNPQLVSISLGVISNFISDSLKGALGKENIRISVIVERKPDQEYVKLQYEGDAEGMKNLPQVIEQVFSDG